MKILKNYYEVEERVEIEVLYKALEDIKLIERLPLNLHSRETNVNISLIKTGIAIYKQGKLTYNILFLFLKSPGSKKFEMELLPFLLLKEIS